MNTSKMKVIWIGDKRHSTEKLPVRYKLEWGTKTFNFLGVQFSVNLNDIPDLNYVKILDKSKTIIHNWKRRCLTPLGKITIIKTFIISNFNYLFASIPSPDNLFISNLNKLLFSYLWDNKPDKITRTCVIQDYKEFGLRMIDLTSHINALKLAWINKLLKDNSSQFCKIVEQTILPVAEISKFGSDWLKRFLKKMYNPFWKEVFTILINVLDKDQLCHKNELLISPLWYNPKIFKNAFFIPKWFSSGIGFVSDVLDDQGVLLTQQQLEQKFSVNINFLDYYRVKFSVGLFLRNNSNLDGSLEQPTQPFIPNHIAFLSKNKTAKGIYEKLKCKNKTQMAFQRKWHNDLNLNLDHASRQYVFKLCFKTSGDVYHKWFQCRILHQILATQELLNKMGISNSPTCLSCQADIESLPHLFYFCPNAKYLWIQLESKMKNSVNFSVHLTPMDT